MQYIKKRDGRVVEFNKTKIVNAILKAFEQIDGEISSYALDKANNIATFIEQENEKILTVEEIQDLVENGLMSTKRKDVARAYIRYRQDRNRIREWNSNMMDKVAIKLAASDVQNQNANVDEYSFGGRRGEADSVIFKQYALDNLVSKMARNNHLNNEIYIHDLDAYILGMHNCLTVPFDDLLANGFNTRQTDVRPANSVNTAFQLVAVLFQLQSLQQFGGVSASHLDWTMVPYVRKSFYKHFKDGLQYIENVGFQEEDFIDNIPVTGLKDINRYYMTNSSKQITLNNGAVYRDNFPFEFYDTCPKAYTYAMDMTTKEVRQAVEGMYHNLNTLQSRSGN